MANTKIKNTVLDSSVISGQSTVTAASGDFVLIQDISDSDNLKKALVSDFGSELAGIDDQSSSNDDQLTITDSAVIINEDSDDVDFRIESNGNANRFFVDGGSNSGEGAVVVGHNASLGQHRVFQVTGTTPDTSGMEMFKYSNDASGPTISLSKSRGGSIGTAASVNDNDIIGTINWFADDGTDTSNYAATIHAEIDGTPGSDDTPGALVFSTTADGANTQTTQMRLSSVGNLHLSGGSDRRIQLGSAGAGANAVDNNTVHIRGDGANLKMMAASGGSYQFEVNGTEIFSSDSSGQSKFTGSGNLLTLNASSGVTYLKFAENGTSRFFLGTLNGSDGLAFIDADGGSTRMKIFADGDVGLGGAETGNIINSSSGVGFYHERGADTVCGRNGGAALSVLRQGSDGQLIRFKKAGSEVGDIKVSSGIVSITGFQGGHESSGIAENLPLGTVVSTIDELDSMDNGDDKPNHPKIKVSDAVGDSRVYGVLQSYSTERNNKPTVAAVGIGFILVTGACSGGDLLESNGDGTAKVQDDDIIRSKTIGKVTIGDSNTGVKSVSCVLYCG